VLQASLRDAQGRPLLSRR